MDLLIHVGLHKTGTTSVQDSLYRSRECLLREGILYPTTGLFGSQHALIPGSLIPKHFFLDRVERTLCTSSYIQDLSKEVEETDPSLVVLSSEVFSEISYDREACLGIINELRQGFTSCSLLLTTRNAQDLALSALKHSARERIEPWIRDPLGSYIRAYHSIKSIQNFWETSGYPIYVKSVDEDLSGNLTDHYFGKIIAGYSERARECIAAKNSVVDLSSNQRLNSDKLPASTYAILFLLGNTDKSHIFAKRPIFSLISKMLVTTDGHMKAANQVTTKHLPGYLEYFRQQADMKLISMKDSVSIDDKIKALSVANVPKTSIQVLTSVSIELLELT